MVTTRDEAHTGPRRELLKASGAAVAVGAALLLEACGGSSQPTIQLQKLAPRLQATDINLLRPALALEFRAVSAYTASFPLLHAFNARTAKRFLQQELDHAAQIWGLMKQAGGKPPAQPPGYDYGQPRDATEALTLLDSIENQQITYYLEVIPKLTPGPVRALVASILANDAQHVSMLRVVLGRDPIPSAFVTAQQ